MRKHIVKKSALLLLICTVVLSGCGARETEDELTTIRFSNNSWDSQMLHNEIAKFVVENAFDGYEVEFSTATSTLNWQAMIKGDVDLDIESWTENVDSYASDIASGSIVEVGDLVLDSAQGFYVPRYVIEGDAARGIEPLAPELKHVRDLINYPDVFENPEDPDTGRIYGATPGWMIDEIMYNKYLHYELDDTFEYARLGSEVAINASLEAAYNKGEGWVGYAFEPTLVSGKLDLVRLEDEPYEESLLESGACEVPAQVLKIVSSAEFAERAPELVPFFEKYQTGSDLVGSALVYLDENKTSHEEAAIWFLTENSELLDEWLTEEQASKVKEALE